MAIILLAMLTVWVGELTAQTCSALGQNPGSAFPICGTKELEQKEVPLCGGKKVPTPCNQPEITDVNPFWYKFKCYQSGTLGLLIVPKNLEDDYDWQLFDITGENPESVYTNPDLFVACNWSGESGKTGTNETATSLVVCGGMPNPTFSKKPEIIEGHEYLLLISHFTESQSGYTVSFEGGTADITDPNLGSIESVAGTCDGNRVVIKLTRPMKCSSLAPDGSDFVLPSGSAAITGASSASCSGGFNTGNIIVTLNKALPQGTYDIRLQTGTDGNTLLDDCDNPMDEATIAFRVPENVSAIFTYDLKEACGQDTLRLLHDGANHTNTWNWTIDQVTSVNQSPQIVLRSPGDKNARLIVSNGVCSDTASQVINVPQDAKAAFTGPDILCAVDPALFTDQSAGNIISWRWDFGNGTSSTNSEPRSFKYPAARGEATYTVSLSVTDAGGCSDSVSKKIVVVGNCNIVVPNAFTPNHDGKNDELFPTNAFGAENLLFSVYNRYGQIVFETRDWQKKWDGNMNGQPQPAGTYVWTLHYVLKATGRKYDLRGTATLIR